MIINGILALWFVLTGLSLLYITYDLIKVTPEAAVMKWGWWLVTLYTGPIGLFFYLLSCKEPMPGTHEQFIAPHWKQALGSMVHCLAGDVTGILLAALVLAFFRVSLPVELTIEYIAGFSFGLLIFQSLFMKNMMGGSYWKALKTSFYPELASMNMIMAAMIPTIVIWTLLEPSAFSPFSPHFWGKISFASILAGIASYPINSWLVRKGLKHGMMTVRPQTEHNTHANHGNHSQHGNHSEPSAHAEHEHAPPTVSTAEMWAKFIYTVFSLLIGILIAILAWHLKKG